MGATAASHSTAVVARAPKFFNFKFNPLAVLIIIPLGRRWGRRRQGHWHCKCLWALTVTQALAAVCGSPGWSVHRLAPLAREPRHHSGTGRHWNKLEPAAATGIPARRGGIQLEVQWHTVPYRYG